MKFYYENLLEFIMLNFLFKGFITINLLKNKLEPAVI